MKECRGTYGLLRGGVLRGRVIIFFKFVGRVIIFFYPSLIFETGIYGSFTHIVIGI
jgi:hypothetical protein